MNMVSFKKSYMGPQHSQEKHLHLDRKMHACRGDVLSVEFRQAEKKGKKKTKSKSQSLRSKRPKSRKMLSKALKKTLEAPAST